MPNFTDNGQYIRDDDPKAAMVRITREEFKHPDAVSSYIVETGEGCPQQVEDVLLHILPVWLDLFQMKSKEYGEAAFELGPRAQFVDMNRKFVKLKAALWEGRELTTEGIDEILLDLIGHCFLTLEMRRRDGSLGSR